jgi:hypothetical protein
MQSSDGASLSLVGAVPGEGHVSELEFRGRVEATSREVDRHTAREFDCARRAVSYLTEPVPVKKVIRAAEGFHFGSEKVRTRNLHGGRHGLQRQIKKLPHALAVVGCPGQKLDLTRPD